MDSSEFAGQLDLFSHAVPACPARHVCDSTVVGPYWLPQHSETVVDGDDARIVLTAAWTGEFWTGGYLVALWPKLLFEVMPGDVNRRRGELYAPDAPIESMTLSVLLAEAARQANLTLASMSPWTSTAPAVQQRLSAILSARSLHGHPTNLPSTK